MVLSAGVMLGPFQIERELGRGGMGEVYLARDTRLDRLVAIKSLPEHLATDPDRLARFQREAKVLASLNHPGVGAIYGLEESAGRQYLILEFVEGETLAVRVSRGAIPEGEALTLARQIAESLEAAHEKGVVHRDIKPGNVMLTRDGAVKVLDFGLARAAAGPTTSTNPAVDPDSPTIRSPAGASPTIPGAIMGTAGYMSPEQARGKPVDKRCDIFSFGCLLYEMLTGRGPFPGETITDALAAVIGRDPDWSALPAGLGPNARRVLVRCLEKGQKQRYRDIGDVALDLAAAPALDGAAGSGSAPSKRLIGLSWSVAALFAIAALVLGVLLWRQRPAGPRLPRFEPLTFAPQFITNARFTSDGRTVVFSAARSGNTAELFVRSPEDAQPRSFGAPNIQLLSVSSKGELAVLVRSRYWCHRTYVGMLARMPLAGGAPREILDDVTGADWFPDGAELAIIRRVGPVSRLEYPGGTVLWEAAGYISDLRISPDGQRLAFVTHAYEADNQGSIVVVDRHGTTIARSVEYTGAEGLAWSSSGAVVLFSSTTKDDEIYTVRELSMDGAIRDVLSGHAGIVVLDAAPARGGGKLLATDFQVNGTIFARFAGTESERELSWLGASYLPIMSRDGRSVVFTDQSRTAGKHYAVCLQAADGSAPVRLGDGIPVDFSADGASVLTMVPSDPPRMMIYPTGAGAIRDISDPEFVSYDFSAMRFTADGRGVLYCGTRKGGASRAYLLDLASGAIRPVTPEGTHRAIAFPDGMDVLACAADGRFNRYPLNGGAPTPVAGLNREDVILGLRPDGKSLLAMRPWEMPARVEVVELATGKRTLLRELAPDSRIGTTATVGVDFSEDEKSYVYAVWRSVGELFLVEGVP